MENKLDISNRVFNLLIVFLVALIGYWCFRSYEIWHASPSNIPREISVEGTGKSQATPDVAQITLGVTTEAKTSEETVATNTTKINDIMTKIKSFKIDQKDIKTTSYYLNPKYDYNLGRNDIIGYTLSQNIEIKVRDFTKIGDIIAQATTAGANTIGGINFIIENPDVAKSKARDEAIAKAKAKAEQIAKQTGLTLGKVVSFYESDYSDNYGKGGGADLMMATEVSTKAVAPDIQPGQQEVNLTVTLSFRVY